MTLTLEFDRRPPPIAYHLRALVPRRGLTEARCFPPIRASWRSHRVHPAYLAELLELTGLRADQGCDVFFPHVFGFPLQMAILTHRAFPLSIWKVLQICNRFLQHRPLLLDANLDLETRVASQRVLEKGAEVDLYTSVRSRDELLWEGLTTFYYRGRFGTPGASARLAKAPAVAAATVAEWDIAAGGGRRFAALTGDYNGIHYWRWYARLLGFQRAFLHPQRALGLCMAHLPAHDAREVQRLDVWLKGPVYYESHVSLQASPDPEGLVFALSTDADPRPAIVGRWSSRSAPALATLTSDDNSA